LIDDCKRKELVRRSAETFFVNGGWDINKVPAHHIAALESAIKMLHDNFFANRTGQCRLIK